MFNYSRSFSPFLGEIEHSYTALFAVLEHKYTKSRESEGYITQLKTKEMSDDIPELIKNKLTALY
jgi:hypothetical protein